MLLINDDGALDDALQDLGVDRALGEHRAVALAHGGPALRPALARGEVEDLHVLGEAGHEAVDVVGVVGVQLGLGVLGRGHGRPQAPGPLDCIECRSDEPAAKLSECSTPP